MTQIQSKYSSIKLQNLYIIKCVNTIIITAKYLYLKFYQKEKARQYYFMK